jgi:hypothetical protein
MEVDTNVEKIFEACMYCMWIANLDIGVWMYRCE